MHILSAWNTSDDAVDTWGGTSMATPHVLGAAALYLARNPTAKPTAVTDAVLGAATTPAWSPRPVSARR